MKHQVSVEELILVKKIKEEKREEWKREKKYNIKFLFNARYARSNYIDGNVLISKDGIYEKYVNKVKISQPTKKFALMNDYTDLYKFTNELPKEERCLYEVVRNYYQKPHFDIDFKYKNYPNITCGEAHCYLQKTLNAIDNVMKKFNVNYSFENNCLVLSSNGMSKCKDTQIEYYKYSFHIVIDKLVHADAFEALSFYKLVLDELPYNMNKEFLDSSVYSTFQNFRMIWCQKKGSHRFFEVDKITKYIPMNHSIEDIKENPKFLELDLLQASLISSKAGCSTLPSFLSYDKNGNPINPRKSKNNVIEINDKQYDELINCFNTQTFGDQYEIGGFDGTKINLMRKCRDECPIHNRIHDSIGAYICIDSYGNFWFNCYRKDKGVKQKGIRIGKVGVPITKETEEVKVEVEEDSNDISSEEEDTFEFGGFSLPRTLPPLKRFREKTSKKSKKFKISNPKMSNKREAINDDKIDAMNLSDESKTIDEAMNKNKANVDAIKFVDKIINWFVSFINGIKNHNKENTDAIPEDANNTLPKDTDTNNTLPKDTDANNTLPKDTEDLKDSIIYENCHLKDSKASEAPIFSKPYNMASNSLEANKIGFQSSEDSPIFTCSNIINNIGDNINSVVEINNLPDTSDNKINCLKMIDTFNKQYDIEVNVSTINNLDTSQTFIYELLEYEIDSYITIKSLYDIYNKRCDYNNIICPYKTKMSFTKNLKSNNFSETKLIGKHNENVIVNRKVKDVYLSKSPVCNTNHIGQKEPIKLIFKKPVIIPPSPTILQPIPLKTKKIIKIPIIRPFDGKILVEDYLNEILVKDTDPKVIRTKELFDMYHEACNRDAKIVQCTSMSGFLNILVTLGYIKSNTKEFNKYVLNHRIKTIYSRDEMINVDTSFHKTDDPVADFIDNATMNYRYECITVKKLYETTKHYCELNKIPFDFNTQKGFTYFLKRKYGDDICNKSVDGKTQKVIKNKIYRCEYKGILAKKAKLHNSYNRDILRGSIIRNDHYVKDIDDMLENKEKYLLMIKAACGLGKTTSIINYIKKNDKTLRTIKHKEERLLRLEIGTATQEDLEEIPESSKNHIHKYIYKERKELEKLNKECFQSVLFVTNRVSLVDKYKSDLEGLGFKMYYDTQSNITADKVVCQIDSLHRIRRKYDLVILDEFTYVQSHLTGFVAKKQLCNDKLELLIKNTNKIIVADALLDEHCLEYMRRLDRDDIITNHYTHQPYINKTYSIINTCDNLQTAIYDAIINGKKIVVPTNVESFASSLAQMLNNKLPNTKVGIYTGKNKSDNHEDVSKDFEKYDVLIYTPVIQCGVSYMGDHFDEIYAYFMTSSSGPDASLQQLIRCRAINRLYLCIEKCNKNNLLCKNSSITTYDQYVEFILRSLDKSKDPKNKINDLSGQKLFRTTTLEGGINTDLAYFQMYTSVMQRSCEGYKNYEFFLGKYLRDMGIRYVDCNDISLKYEYISDDKILETLKIENKDEYIKEMKSELKMIKKGRKSEEAERIVKALDVNDETLKKISSKVNKTQEDIDILKRNKICKIYQVKQFDKEFVIEATKLTRVHKNTKMFYAITKLKFESIEYYDKIKEIRDKMLKKFDELNKTHKIKFFNDDISERRLMYQGTLCIIALKIMYLLKLNPDDDVFIADTEIKYNNDDIRLNANGIKKYLMIESKFIDKYFREDGKVSLLYEKMNYDQLIEMIIKQAFGLIVNFNTKTINNVFKREIKTISVIKNLELQCFYPKNGYYLIRDDTKVLDATCQYYNYIKGSLDFDTIDEYYDDCCTDQLLDEYPEAKSLMDLGLWDNFNAHYSSQEYLKI